MPTLSDLQTERERLRAANAKSAFDAAMAETSATADLLAAGRALQRVVMEALDAALPDMVAAISGERDETRVHYLLSETAHLWLTSLGDKVARECDALPVIGARFRRGARPRDLLTVSEWADRHRELKSGTNAPGPWRTSMTLYPRNLRVGS